MLPIIISARVRASTGLEIPTLEDENLNENMLYVVNPVNISLPPKKTSL